MSAPHRLLRTIRLDPSDRVVFAQAAEPGEWAVPGTFMFAGRDIGAMSRKAQIAFRSGFLGIASFGHSTLVCVTDATADERAEAVQTLAQQLLTHLGAPSLAAALPAAEEEIALSEDLCRGHAAATLVALKRGLTDQGITEQFRTLKPRDETAFSADYLRGHDRAFHFVEADDDGEDHGLDITALRKSGAA